MPKNASITRNGLVQGEGGGGISLLQTCLRQHLHHPPNHERLSTPRGLRPLQSTDSIHQTGWHPFYLDIPLVTRIKAVVINSIQSKHPSIAKKIDSN